MAEDNKTKIETVAVSLLTGVLSNPNYNFDNIKKAVTTAVEHARALVLKVAETVEADALAVAKVADKVGDIARGSDDDKKDHLSE